MAAALAVAAGGWWLYETGVEAGQARAEAAALREQRIGQLAADRAASAAVAAIANIRVKHTTIRQEAEREIQTRTEYRDCSHSPEQLQRLNAALSGAAPPGAAASGVSTADAAGR